jgi:hypothetical protein
MLHLVNILEADQGDDDVRCRDCLHTTWSGLKINNPAASKEVHENIKKNDGTYLLDKPPNPYEEPGCHGRSEPGAVHLMLNPIAPKAALRLAVTHPRSYLVDRDAF